VRKRKRNVAFGPCGLLMHGDANALHVSLITVHVSLITCREYLLNIRQLLINLNSSTSHLFSVTNILLISTRCFCSRLQQACRTRGRHCPCGYKHNLLLQRTLCLHPLCPKDCSTVQCVSKQALNE